LGGALVCRPRRSRATAWRSFLKKRLPRALPLPLPLPLELRSGLLGTIDLKARVPATVAGVVAINPRSTGMSDGRGSRMRSSSAGKHMPGTHGVS
ncbi:hypothetical protein KEM52_003277, partial [Ascosphaera acerosa]